jgi:two-component system OmpR family response regulator
MFKTYTRSGYLSNETSTQDHALTLDRANAVHIPKVFVVCDQRDTAPVWGYILRQQGLLVILETSRHKAIDRWTSETPDLVVLDVDIKHQERMELFKKFREVSVAPVLLLLPAYHETEILDAYAGGVDEVVVKPISPAIFLAKIMAWGRRGWTVPVSNLSLIRAGKHSLDPARKGLTGPNGLTITLTTLEFRLLHLLMGRPGHIFSAEEIIETLWGAFGSGDPVLLKNVVYRLRKKIEADPSHPVLLQTWQGGYSFQG